MKKSIFGIFTLFASGAFASGPSIPYSVSCQGAHGDEGRIQITTDNVPRFTLKRSLSSGGPVDFVVNSTGHANGYFTVKSLGAVDFAGGGTLEGSLNVHNGTGVGQWSEKTTAFNEATQRTEVTNKTYNVVCSIAQ